MNRSRAVVVGAGYAGLLAAHVLATRFTDVVLLERDTTVPSGQPRKGVPQGYHPHYLLERGATVLEDFFPGLRADMEAGGVETCDFGEGMRFLLPSGWTPRTSTGIRVQSPSRPYLEQQILDRVTQHPNISLRRGFTVDALATSTSPRRVSGVHGQGNTTRQQLQADLVVIATGRDPQLTRWLTGVGIPAPKERIVRTNVAYATRFYNTHPNHGYACQAILPYAPDHNRAGAVLAIEKGRSMAILFGVGNGRPPRDEEAFRAYAKNLPDPFVFDFIETHTPATVTHQFVERSNRWRMIHRIRTWPDGLVVLGDAVCRFNPIYGQGLTVAALQAQALAASLDAGEPALRFQKRCARILRIPWLMSTSADLAWNTDSLQLLPRAVHRYFTRVINTIPHHPDTYRTFARVQHMKTHPAALLTPRFAARAILKGRASTARGRVSEPLR